MAEKHMKPPAEKKRKAPPANKTKPSAANKTKSPAAAVKKRGRKPRRRKRAPITGKGGGLRAVLLTGAPLLLAALILGAAIFLAMPEKNPPPAEVFSPKPSTGVLPPEQVRSTPVEPPPTVRPSPEAPSRPPGASPTALTIRPEPVSPPPVPAPRPVTKGILAFVIDDAGNSLRELEPFLRFPGPLTIAVLPGLPHSAEAARRIRAAGKEVFLHQPMEAQGGQDPGPRAIYGGMSPDEVRAVIEGNLAEIGPVAGMNNHQGSRITEDEALMETVLAICREQGIYFLDSRTTADTAAPAAAKKLGIRIGERDVFLDNEVDRASIIGYLESGVALAERRGAAVMIGHTWTGELAPILEERYPELREQGYTLATFSYLMEGNL